jgi:putative ABC transport system ATP-binding protein
MMNMPASDAIVTKKISRHYKLGAAVIRAVDEVSLEIKKGELVALLGASGSGKSTLLNLFAGLDRATAGSAEVLGHNLAQASSEELSRYRRLTVGMVFQSFNLIPSMTVFENIELPLRFAEAERSTREGLVRTAIERVELSHRSGHRPSELSGGEQQRVSIARARINNPSILLADEPTGNLDSRTGNEIMNVIRRCNDELKMTIVMVTHERSIAEQFAQRMIFMGDGKITSQLEPKTDVSL